MSRMHTRLHTFLFSIWDNQHQFVLMMYSEVKTPFFSQIYKRTRVLLLETATDGVRWSVWLIWLLQVSLQLVGCAASTAVVPLTKTRAWGWHSPSPMNLDTSMVFFVVFFVSLRLTCWLKITKKRICFKCYGTKQPHMAECVPLTGCVESGMMV